MSKVIKINKGLDIKLLGESSNIIAQPLDISLYAVKPTDFIGVIPKMLVEEGNKVEAGQALFYNKADESMLFPSPVSGTVSEIRRGEKRLIKEIVITSDGKFTSVRFSIPSLATASRDEIVELLLKSGLWSLIRQRPYNVIPSPKSCPKSIFVSGFDTSPLAPDYDLIVHGKGNLFQKGLDVLAKLTTGKLYLNLHVEKNKSKVFSNSKGVEITWFDGKHPAGNVGVQIHHIDPINKGEEVWHVNPQDIITIGRLFEEGIYFPEKIIALTGSEVTSPQYHKIISGASVSEFVSKYSRQNHIRVISGNVLTGENIGQSGFLGYYHNQITMIPEGDKYDFMGWIKPGLNKYSFANTCLSGLFSGILSKKKYVIDTNLNGGPRALVLTGEFEKVFPMDIYPTQLIKACIIEDIDLMEQLGIYEVDEEDFALCEFIDVSKTDIQSIIRKGLDLVRKENS